MTLQSEIAQATQGRPVRIVSITTITQARMYKRLPGAIAGETSIAGLDPINPFWSRRVVKVAQRNGLVGADYAKAVLAQREREVGSRKSEVGAAHPTSDLRPPTFQPGPLWRGMGAHVDRHFVRHIETGQRYLKFLPTTDQAGREQIVRLKYFYADTLATTPEEISAQWIQRWLVPQRQPKTQLTRRPIRWKCITVDNVAEITIARVTYSFIDAKSWQPKEKPPKKKRAA
jgi:hypothetical protein